MTFDLRFLAWSPLDRSAGWIGLTAGVSSLDWITRTCSWTPTEVENTKKLGASEKHVCSLLLSLDLPLYDCKVDLKSSDLPNGGEGRFPKLYCGSLDPRYESGRGKFFYSLLKLSFEVNLISNTQFRCMTSQNGRNTKYCHLNIRIPNQYNKTNVQAIAELIHLCYIHTWKSLLDMLIFSLGPFSFLDQEMVLLI